MDAWWCGPSLDHYRCSIFYCPETRSYRISGSFDLFPQHCLLPEFTLEHQPKEVHKELVESIGRLNKTSGRKLVKALAKTAKDLATTPNTRTPQRVEPEATSEGEGPTQRVATAPPVTTTTDHTAPRRVMEAPRSHQRVTRNNTPMSVPTIQIKVPTP